MTDMAGDPKGAYNNMARDIKEAFKRVLCQALEVWQTARERRLGAYTWVVGISGDCTCCAGRIYIKWSLVMPHIHKVVTCTSDILNVVTWHQRYTRCARLTTTEQACGRLILGLLLLSCYRLMPKRYRCC